MEKEDFNLWQEKEDEEQIRYLQWHQELNRFKRVLISMPHTKEKYKLGRRVCGGYKGSDVALTDLVDSLTATFMLKRSSAVTQQKLQRVLDNYLNNSSKQLLNAWTNKGKALNLNTDLSPLSVARLFAQVASKTGRDIEQEPIKVETCT